MTCEGGSTEGSCSAALHPSSVLRRYASCPCAEYVMSARPRTAQAQARLADARDAVAGPLAAAGERVRRLVAPAADPPAPSLADARRQLPAPGTGEESWLGGALRPLRGLVGMGALAQDALERK